MAVIATLLTGCAILLVGCAGAGSGATKEKQQGHTEASKLEQAHSPEATSSEEARCEATRSFHRKNYLGTYVTNDMPGCPHKGGLLSGTDGQDNLAGMDGDDEIRGRGDQDALFGGPGNDALVGSPNHEEGRYKGMDVLWGGPGSDVLHGGAGTDHLYSSSLNGGGLQGKDVLYGEDGNDLVLADDYDKQDKLYCGKGWDRYLADKGDYVDSSCEKKWDGTVT